MLSLACPRECTNSIESTQRIDDPLALIGDEAYDADASSKLSPADECIRSSLPIHAARFRRGLTFAIHCERDLVERLLNRSSTVAASQRFTTTCQSSRRPPDFHLARLKTASSAPPCDLAEYELNELQRFCMRNVWTPRRIYRVSGPLNNSPGADVLATRNLENSYQ